MFKLKKKNTMDIIQLFDSYILHMLNNIANVYFP
jgi:hypothetical protein